MQSTDLLDKFYLSSAQKRMGGKNQMMMMSPVRPRMVFNLLFLMLIIARSDGENLEPQWCIADEQTPDDVLQQALDWACGFGGADCRMIQSHKPCYVPNTIKDHASYAFNSYWQKFKHHGGSCYFNAAAMVTDVDPSHGPCKYESVP